MDDFVFSPIQIPFYQDDPFTLEDSIFQYLQHHTNSLLTSSTTSVPSSVETDRQVLTSAAATTAAAPTITTTAAAPTTTNSNKGKRRRKPSNPEVNGSGRNPSDKIEKMAGRKEVERERRSEMAQLCASLKKLLPVEDVKEKLALPDHIHQATNYIKHKKETIRELEMKRNKLKSELGVDMARSSSSNITFTVESCSDGTIDILVKSDLAEDWFPLSRVLNVLLKEGLAVLSCNYTKLNQKLYCTIRTDVGGRQMNDADLCLLREKLEAKVAD